MRIIHVIDTNIFSFLLGVKGTPRADLTIESVKEKIKEIDEKGETIVIPLPVMIETGNQLTNSSTNKEKKCQNMIELIERQFDNKRPWHSFSEQNIFWEKENLRKILNVWHEQVNSINFGDFLIIALAAYLKEEYRQRGDYEVLLWTEDNNALKAFEGTEFNFIFERNEISKRRKVR
jgi:predicted nucleic-acid-binding protein